jgi:hypothetical protein
MKRGISVVVATVLMILITIAAIGVLWAIILPMLNSIMLFDEPAEMKILDGYAVLDADRNLIDVKIKRGRDYVELFGFEIIFVFDGNSVKHFISENLSAMDARVYSFNLSGYGKLDSVMVSGVYDKDRRGPVLYEVSALDIKRGDLSTSNRIYIKIGSSEAFGFLPTPPTPPTATLAPEVEPDSEYPVVSTPDPVVPDPDPIDPHDLDDIYTEKYNIKELSDKFNDFYFDKYPDGIIDTYPYNFDSHLAGLISIYEATGNISYIGYAMINAERLFSHLVDVDGDGYMEWTYYNNYDHDNNPATSKRTYCLDSNRGIRQISRLARVVKKNATLNAAYGNRADELVKTIKKDFVNNPVCKARFYPNYQTVYHIISHQTLVLLELYRIEGNVEFLEGRSDKLGDVVNAHANTFKNSYFIQPDGKSVAWGHSRCKNINYTYPPCYYVNMIDKSGYCEDDFGQRYCSVEDVSHSESYIYVATELEKEGIFTRADVEKLSDLIYFKIWDGDFQNPRFYDFVDGKQQPLDGKYNEWAMGSNLAPGWISLGSYNTTLQMLFENIEGSSISNKQMLNRMAYYGELARNVKILKGL